MSEPEPITPEQQVLVDAVMAHAVEHYEDGGWDVIVECWDSTMIRDRLVRFHPDVTLPDEAVAAFVVVASIWRDRQDDARNSAF